MKNEDKAKIENLNVDWEKFENADEEEFINISVTHDTLFENKYQLKYGTILEISGLRDEWDRDRILKLKKSFRKMIVTDLKLKLSQRKREDLIMRKKKKEKKLMDL